MDLQKLIDEITIPKIPDNYLPTILYDQNVLNTTEKVTYLKKQINKAKNRNDNNLVLYYLYTIGRLVEEETRYEERRACLHKLTEHYKKVTKRLARLFEQDREPLLMRCKYFTLTNISLLSVEDYKKILAAAERATANRFLALYSEGLENTTGNTSSEDEIIDVSAGGQVQNSVHDSARGMIESLEENGSQEDLESLERENCNP